MLKKSTRSSGCQFVNVTVALVMFKLLIARFGAIVRDGAPSV